MIQSESAENRKQLHLSLKGTCAGDLFHILHNNGYAVQMDYIPFEDTFRLDVTLKESEEK